MTLKPDKTSVNKHKLYKGVNLNKLQLFLIGIQEDLPLLHLSAGRVRGQNSWDAIMSLLAFTTAVPGMS